VVSKVTNVQTSVSNTDIKKINTDFEYKYQSINIPHGNEINCKNNITEV
jgi:hypothetical protein